MKAKIRHFLEKKNPLGVDVSFSDDESLLDAGIIDSVTMIDLISFLEAEFAVSIDEDDMTPENFDSVNAIAAFVGRRGDVE